MKQFQQDIFNRELSAMNILVHFLRRHLLFAILCLTVCIGVSVVAWKYLPPDYEAKAMIAISPVFDPVGAVAGTQAIIDNNRVEGEAAAVHSTAFLARVAERRLDDTDYIGLAGTKDGEDLRVIDLAEAIRDRLSVQRIGASSAIEISVIAGQPDQAERIVNDIAEIYVSSRGKVLDGGTISLIKRIDAELETVSSDLADAELALSELLSSDSDGIPFDVAVTLAGPETLTTRTMLLALQDGVDRDALLQVQKLKQNLGMLEDRRNALLQDAEEVRRRSLLTSTDARVIESGAGSAVERSARLPLLLFLGSILGLGAGLGIPLIRDFLRGVLYDPAELVAEAALPVWATTPHLRRDGLRSLSAAMQGQHVRSRDARRFMNSIAELAVAVGARKRSDGGARRILVASAMRGDGKSTVARGLASVLSAAGQTVLLVRLDEKLVSLPMADAVSVPTNSPSATHVLDALIEPGSGQISVLAADAVANADNPVAAEFPALLEVAAKRFDNIVFDMSGAIGNPGIALAMTGAECCAFVIRPWESSRADVLAALRELRFFGSGNALAGIVFNAGRPR